MNSLIAQARFQATKAAISLGPGNPAVLFMIRRKCRSLGCDLRLENGVLSLEKGDRRILLAARHFVYAPTLAEMFDAYFDPLVPTLAGGLWTLDYSRPKLQTYKRSGLQFELAAFPEEESMETYCHWYTPKPGDLVYDVGSHCGVSVHYFSQLVGPSGRVIALEPDSLNYSLLLRNIERHQLRNVEPVKAALSNRTGRMAFCGEGTLGSHLSHVGNRETVGESETVDTLTLADCFARFGVPVFCKVDIEGSEVEVFEEARPYLADKDIQFALDTGHVVNGAPTHPAVEKSFREAGFEAQSEVVDGFMITWARRSSTAIS